MYSVRRTWVRLAAFSAVVTACGSSNGTSPTTSRVEHEPASMTFQPKEPKAQGSNGAESVFELIGTADGVFRYDALTGVTVRACEGSASQLYRLDDSRVLYVDPSAMVLRICDVRSGARAEVTTIRVGDGGPIPAKVRLERGADQRYVCILATSRDAARSIAARDQIADAWLTIDLERRTAKFRVRKIKQSPTRTPLECRQPIDGSRPADGNIVLLGGAPFVPVLQTSEKRWLVLRGDVLRAGTGQAPASEAPSVPVVLFDTVEGRTYPLREGAWGSPIAPSNDSFERPASQTAAVPMASPVFELHGDGWIAIGPYAVKPGLLTRRVTGELSRSNRHIFETRL